MIAQKKPIDLTFCVRDRFFCAIIFRYYSVGINSRLLCICLGLLLILYHKSATNTYLSYTIPWVIV